MMYLVWLPDNENWYNLCA